MPRAYAVTVLSAAALAAGASGCGSGSDSTTIADRPAPPASDFPAAQGRSLNQIVGEAQPTNDVVVAPTSSVFHTGENRFGFGVFTTGREEITDADVAIYAAPHGGGPAVGPFPARMESLHVDPQFESQTTAQDPDAAHTVYVSDLKFSRDGNWDLVALVRRGDSLQATLVPSIQVGRFPDIPQVGEPPPAIHTPTVQDVGGDVAKIDTRSPHDDMHDVDFANVLGKQPVVLIFATPALCQSRVCGPVVDVTEQVKHDFADRGVAFIHMEVYAHNDANAGLRAQMKAFHLPTEPWVFVIDRQGRVSTRIEGAFGLTELEQAVQKVAG